MNNIYKLCDYGCGKIAKFYFKYVDKWCCSNHYTKCSNSKEKQRIIQTGINRNFQTRNNISKGKKNYYKNLKNREKCSIIQKERWENMSDEEKKKFGEKTKGDKNGMYGKSSANKLTIKKLNKKYPLFSQIEEMRYNPDKTGEKEIQVKCKNHNCKNSKEQDGWFTPTRIQLSERIRCIEKNGTDNSYFYCCQECKDICPLFNSRGFDLFSKKEIKIYTQQEYQQFRQFVLQRDNHICQYCGNKAEHVHHERPQKLEPFYSLDPDLAWSCCSKCHYEKGHKDECSTGVLATINC